MSQVELRQRGIPSKALYVKLNLVIGTVVSDAYYMFSGNDSLT